MKEFKYEDIELKKGPFLNREEGMGLVEAAAWFAGETHSSNPKCICPIIMVASHSVNDWTPDEFRGDLKDLIFKIANTGNSSKEVQEKRIWKVLDWASKDVVSFIMDNFENFSISDNISQIPEITDRLSSNEMISVYSRLEKNSNKLPQIIMKKLAFAVLESVRGSIFGSMSLWGSIIEIDPKFYTRDNQRKYWHLGYQLINDLTLVK